MTACVFLPSDEKIAPPFKPIADRRSRRTCLLGCAINSESWLPNIHRWWLWNLVECVIMGDLNYNYVLGESLCNNPLTYLSQIAGLSQFVDKPTRETTSSSSLIDIILITIPSSRTTTGVIKLALSDHYMPYTVMSHSMPKSHGTRNTIRNFKHFNEEMFLYDVHNRLSSFKSNWSTCVINLLWNKWKVSFEKICSHHAPLVHVKGKNRHTPWTTLVLL